MTRIYRYVGSADQGAADEPPFRQCVQSPQDVLDWIERTGQRLDADGSVVATFVVATDGGLWIADRHSEHVQCARGREMLSAGEMTFTLQKRKVGVTAATNQSTGYCPEPASWPSVAAALERANLPHPPAFTTEFTFRRCPACGAINLVKDDWFVCGVCESPLPERWNVDQTD